MTEYIAKRELRDLTLWGSEEPDELIEEEYHVLKEVFDDWKPWDLTEEELNVKIPVPSVNLTTQQINELKDIVGVENIKTDPKNRILYSHGGSAEDLLRIRLGKFFTLCEAMIMPETEEQIVKLLQWCEKHDIPCIPYGGRTCVTRALEFSKPGIALSLHPHFSKLIELNKNNLTITVGAGTLGPELDAIIIPENLTLGHYPQSWEQSQVGGWIAARAAGQNSTKYGKIEDLVINIRVATSQGTFESELCPARATGPHWFPYFIGSEGTLGVITQATLRLKPLHDKNRAFASYLFRSFKDGVEALKEVCQTEFLPAVARLSDSTETTVYQVLSRHGREPDLKNKLIEWYLNKRGYIDGERCILLLVYEGSKDYVKNCKSTMDKFAKRHGAINAGKKYTLTWFKDRFEHPHLRDKAMDIGLLTDTLETATTWDNIVRLRNEARKPLRDECRIVTSHISHSYAEGANLYFIYITPIEKGKEIEQVRRLQSKAVSAFKEGGGVTSHHHGVGKAFIPWARQEWNNNSQKELVFKMAYGIKEQFDPHNILNPNNFPFDKWKSEEG